MLFISFKFFSSNTTVYMKVQCLYSAKISSKASILHHFLFKSWGSLIVLGISHRQVIKAFSLYFQNSWLTSVLMLEFLVTCKYLIPLIWNVTLCFIRISGCLMEGKKSWLQNHFISGSHGFSENLKDDFTNRDYSTCFLIFLVFLCL